MCWEINDINNDNMQGDTATKRKREPTPQKGGEEEEEREGEGVEDGINRGDLCIG